MCVYEWNGIRPHHNIPCKVCPQTRVAFELITCEHCGTIDIYLPSNTFNWWLTHKHCESIWKPDLKQTITLLLYCPIVKQTADGKVKNNRKKEIKHDRIDTIDMKCID